MLIVIDMQRDYDTNANVKLYGSVRSPYANDIGQFVPAINAIRRARSWDRVVFTLDWLPAAMLSGRTPFCEADSAGAALLDGLDVDASLDVCFRKDSDDSFCDTGGIPESNTGCSRLADVLATLGYDSASADLTFVGQRFERCMLKTVMHARGLGYTCTIVEEGTYLKTQEPDPEWSLPHETPAVASPADVFLATKSAGGRLARGYLLAAGVSILPTLPVIEAEAPFPDEPRIPLRDVVASLLIDWGVDSEDSEGSDDFCGWHVSRLPTDPITERRWFGSTQDRRPSNSAAQPRNCSVQ